MEDLPKIRRIRIRKQFSQPPKEGGGGEKAKGYDREASLDLAVHIN